MGRQLIFECPRGCKAAGDRPIASTIRGWKVHMARAHKTYTEDELAAIVGSTPSSPDRGKAEFLAEADTHEVLPTDNAGESAAAPGSEPRTVDASKTADAVSRKFSGKINKFKASLAKQLPNAVNEALKERAPDWQMSPGNLETLSDSIEACFDALDIDFRITPFATTLTNPLWVLVLPAIALLLIFIPIGVKNAKSNEEVPSGSDASTGDGKPVAL